jgi:guanine deaminase
VTNPDRFAVRGRVLHALAADRLEHVADALVEVEGGRIVACGPADDARAARHGERLIALSRTQLLLPGLVDLHVHAPQFPQLGTALDLPLERWLLDYTFPLEARYADTAYAAQVYDRLVRTLLANGTTTATYFATLHLPATQILAETCLRHGQRALVGRVAMDHPEQCPESYRDTSADVAFAETRALIEAIRVLPGNDGLVLPAITPRFIPACTDDLLRGLGALAAETGCHVQTHCSESDWQHAHVAARCGCSDTEALRRFGLLTRRTVLAHGNHIDAHDLGTLARTGAGIAHCPLSNIYFADAVLPLREALSRAVHVGLGTDIAGGASPSLLDAARMAITASRALESGVDPARPRAQRGRAGARIDAVAAFWLATAGGGEVLDLPIGLFRPGYAFDALLLDAGAADSNLVLSDDDAPERLLERIVHTASRADIARVWVAGRRVR